MAPFPGFAGSPSPRPPFHCFMNVDSSKTFSQHNQGRRVLFAAYITQAEGLLIFLSPPPPEREISKSRSKVDLLFRLCLRGHQDGRVPGRIQPGGAEEDPAHGEDLDAQPHVQERVGQPQGPGHEVERAEARERGRDDAPGDVGMLSCAQKDPLLRKHEGVEGLEETNDAEHGERNADGLGVLSEHMHDPGPKKVDQESHRCAQANRELRGWV